MEAQLSIVQVLGLGLMISMSAEVQAQETRIPDVQIHINYSSTYEKCSDSDEGVTSEVIACMFEENKIWDARLNVAYRSIMSKGAFSNHGKDELREAQRAWLLYRTKACAAAGDLVAEGGSDARLLSESCFLAMTAQRAVDLETYLR
jgi:uncharacterized protein YecT (DUF1311 family)